MTKLRDLNVNIYEGTDALQALRDSIMTGRTSMSTAITFNLINDLVERIEELESQVVDLKATEIVKATETVKAKATPRKASTKNASNQSGGTMDETPKVAEEPTGE